MCAYQGLHTEPGDLLAFGLLDLTPQFDAGKICSLLPVACVASLSRACI